MTQSRNTNYKSNYECFPNNSIYNFLSNMLTTYFSTRNLYRTFYTGTKVLTLENGYLMRFYASQYSIFKVLRDSIGLPLAFDRLLCACLVSHVNYFKSYWLLFNKISKIIFGWLLFGSM